jgi:uncharacterized membrane protein YphA (DoxX/SURF4 family)
MNVVLWVIQILLALAFFVAGTLKVSRPINMLKKNMHWVEKTAPPLVRLVGVLEILGALGLILPAVTHILPWLIPVAAICLALTMIGAIIVHILLKETMGSLAPLILLLLTLLVAYGRFVLVPLS